MRVSVAYETVALEERNRRLSSLARILLAPTEQAAAGTERKDAEATPDAVKGDRHRGE